MKQGGSTLLDVIAAAAICALGAFLLIPSLTWSGAEDSAACMDNLRRIGRAEQKYAADWDGNVWGNDRYIHNLTENGYLPGRPDDVYLCPHFYPYNDLGDSPAASRNATYGQLTFHQVSRQRRGAPDLFDVDGDRDLSFTRLSGIAHPDRYIRYADSIITTMDPPQQWHVITIHSSSPSFHMRHDGKANVLFADGSVRAAGEADIMEHLRYCFVPLGPLTGEDVYFIGPDLGETVLELEEGKIVPSASSIF